jgi:glutaredoxin
MKKVMKITIYTTTDCQFSKQEKEYFQAHNLPYEEKNLETNKEFLTEMLVISNNFAGTPVTKIEKDDGQISILKGFTKEEFDKVLGLEEQLSQSTPTSFQSETVVSPTTPPASISNPVAPVTNNQTVTENPSKQNELDAILNNLQQKTQSAAIPESSSLPVTSPSLPPTPENVLPQTPPLQSISSAPIEAPPVSSSPPLTNNQPQNPPINPVEHNSSVANQSLPDIPDLKL